MRRTAILYFLIMGMVGVGKVNPKTSMSPHCDMMMPTLLAAGQDIPAPPPGNPGHEKPADGAYCDHTSEPAHSCTCHRECKDTEDEDGKQSTYVQEDPKCRVYCYKNACRCPVHNCD